MIHLDLRPPLSARRRAARRRAAVQALIRDRGTWCVIAATVALALLGRWTESDLRARLSDIRADEARIDAVAAELRREIASADTLAAEQARRRAGLHTIRQLDRDRFAFARLLDAAARSAPPNVWLESVSLDAYDPATGEIRVRLRGFAPAHQQATWMESRLNQSGVVRDLRLGAVGPIRFGGFPVARWEMTGSAGGTPAAAPTTEHIGVADERERA